MLVINLCARVLVLKSNSNKTWKRGGECMTNKFGNSRRLQMQVCEIKHTNDPEISLEKKLLYVKSNYQIINLVSTFRATPN